MRRHADGFRWRYTLTGSADPAADLERVRAWLEAAGGAFPDAAAWCDLSTGLGEAWFGIYRHERGGALPFDGAALARRFEAAFPAARCVRDDDTLINHTLSAEYLVYVERLGFERVFELDKGGARGDVLRVYARRDGLVLKVDNFYGESLNAATLFFRCRPRASWRTGAYQGDPRFQFYSPPSVYGRADTEGRSFCYGLHDVRSDLVRTCRFLAEHAELLAPWPRPWMDRIPPGSTLTLDHSGDHASAGSVTGWDHRAVNLTEARMAALEPWARALIGWDDRRPRTYWSP